MKTSFKVISVLSALAILSGCPDKGGGSAAQPAVPVGPVLGGPGINSNNSCTQEATIVANNIVLNNNLNECPRLQSLLGSQSCQATLNYTNQPFTLSYGNNEIQSRCHANPNQQGYPQATNGYPIYQPSQGLPQNSVAQQIQGMKNFICSIDIANGSASGSVTNMPVYAFSSGANVDLFTTVQKSKSFLGGLINFFSSRSSNRTAFLKMIYKPGIAGQGDTLTVSADLRNGKFISATGYAGSAVSLEVNDDASETLVSVTCAGQDQFKAGVTKSGDKVRCSVKEDNKKLESYLNPAADLTSSGIYLSKTSDLFAQSDDLSTLTTTILERTFKATTSLSSPSSVTIKFPGYSSTTNCNLL